MKVVILARGMGTRLQEETSVKPKPMVEIGGRPILWHIMKHFAHRGIKEFLLRKRPGGHEEIPLDLGKILSAKARDVPLQDDDIVFVPSSATKGGLKSVSGVLASVAAAAVYHF